MRNLLSSTRRRELEIIEFLYNKNNWISIEEISNYFNCSKRTISKSLKTIKNEHDNLSIISSNNGIFLLIEGSYGIETIYRKMFNDNYIYQMFEYLLRHGDTEMDDLAENLFISTPTFYRLINAANEVLENNYQIKITTSPVSIQGDESRVRFLLAQYYTESYSSFDWPFTNVKEDIIAKLIHFTQKYFSFNLTDASFRALKLSTTVHLLRTKNGDLSEIEFCKNKANKLHSSLLVNEEFKAYQKEFYQHFHLELDQDCLEQLFGGYLKSLYFPTITEWKNSTNKMATASYQFLAQFFSNLEVDFKLPLKNKDQLLLHLHNTIQLEGLETKTNFLLSKRKKLFCQMMKDQHKLFYENLKEGIIEYRDLMHQTNDEQMIYHMIYLVYISWENLLTYLYKKKPKIKALVVSDFNEGHAKLIKDIISYHTSELDIVVSNSLNLGNINNNHYDIVISNFYIPLIDRENVLCVDSAPTKMDLRLLDQMIEGINKKRKLTNDFKIIDSIESDD